MFTKHQRHHRTTTWSHAVKNRARDLVQQDRCEAMVDSTQPQDDPRVFLEIVANESELIRETLQLCDRISRAIKD